MVFKAFLKIVFSNQNNNFIRFFKLKEIQYIRSNSNQNGTLIMANLQQKNELIQVIEKLQLPEHLRLALDQVHTAEQVIQAVCCLQHLSEQWHRDCPEVPAKMHHRQYCIHFIRFIHNYLQFNLKQITLYIYLYKACAMVALTKKL